MAHLRRALVLAALGTLGGATIFGCGSSLDSSATTLESATSSEPASSDSLESVPSDSSDPGSGVPTTSAAGVDNRFDRAKEALAAGDFSTMLELLSSLAWRRDRGSCGDDPRSDRRCLQGSAARISWPTCAKPNEIDDILRRHIIDEALTFDELAAKADGDRSVGETLAVATGGTEITVEGAVVAAVR